MNTPSIVINERTLYFSRKDGEWFIALKPICEALGLDWSWYKKAVKDDPILGQLGWETTLVAADGKRRKMICLPERYIYGWLFQLQSKNENLLAFKRTCYDALFDHFHGSGRKREMAIKERLLAQREMATLRKELQADPRYARLEQLQGLVLRTGKELKAADTAIEQEQYELFAEEQEELQ